MRRTAIRHVSPLLVAMLLGGGSAVWAVGRSVPDLAELARGSELIFLGQVVEIRTALSEPAEGRERGLPHTFVTYRVERIVRGSVDGPSARSASDQKGRTVTLRFAGGPFPDGTVLRVSSVPRFDVGDRDILFVRANGVANCPLAGWLNGRMRVIDGRLYTEEGQEIIRTRDGRLGWGVEHDFPEVMTHTAGGEEYTLRRDKPLPEGEEADHASAPPKGRALPVEDFLDRLAARLGESPASLRPVISADPSQPFPGLVATPVRISTGPTADGSARGDS